MVRGPSALWGMGDLSSPPLSPSSLSFSLPSPASHLCLPPTPLYLTFTFTCLMLCHLPTYHPCLSCLALTLPLPLPCLPALPSLPACLLLYIFFLLLMPAYPLRFALLLASTHMYLRAPAAYEHRRWRALNRPTTQPVTYRQQILLPA